MFEASDVHRLLKAADDQMRAMIYLGINAALGPADIARLPIKAIDMAGGWLTFARRKTGVGRRIPLWPETIKAIKLAVKNRPDGILPKNAGLVSFCARVVALGQMTKAPVTMPSLACFAGFSTNWECMHGNAGFTACAGRSPRLAPVHSTPMPFRALWGTWSTTLDRFIEFTSTTPGCVRLSTMSTIGCGRRR